MESIFSLHVCRFDSTLDKARPHLALASRPLGRSFVFVSVGGQSARVESLPRSSKSPAVLSAALRPQHKVSISLARRTYCSDSPAAAPEIAEVPRP